MSAKQIVLLAVLAIADICVLGMGVVILMMNTPTGHTTRSHVRCRWPSPPSVTPSPTPTSAFATPTPASADAD